MSLTYWRLRMTSIRTFVDQELVAFRSARDQDDLVTSWRSLERAHVFSQSDVWLHTKVHWIMLTYAVRLGDWREALGQIVRISVAGIGTALGKAPVGNTGRASVPLMATMDVPPEIKEALEQLKVSEDS